MASSQENHVQIRTMRPRPRLGRRFIVKLILSVFTLIGGYALWGGWMQYRLDARLAALHAAGEPIYAADFDDPILQPGQNAADDLIAAGAIVRASPEMKPIDRWNYWVSLPLTHQEATEISAAVSANARALRLIETALGRTQVRWPPSLGDSEWLDNLRAAANFLRLDALLAHQQRRETDAMARVWQLVNFAKVVDRDPRLASHYVSLSILFKATDAAEEIASDLRVGPSGVETHEVRSLIVTLLDDAPSRAGLVRALLNERVNNYVRCTNLPKAVQRDVPWVMRPAMRVGIWPFAAASADFSLQVDTVSLNAFKRSSDLPTLAADADVASVSAHIKSSRLNLCFVNSDSPARAAACQYLHSVECRLVAVALAVRLYAVDHAGQWPQTLAELTPVYLPTVPSDPMLSGSTSLRYGRTPDGEPIVYSVGINGVDEGGSQEPRPERRSDYFGSMPVYRWDAKDAVLSLKRPQRYFSKPQKSEATGWWVQPLPDQKD
jgi:hypothetical protein